MRTIRAELIDNRLGDALNPAGCFQKLAEDSAQPDDHGNETERASHAVPDRRYDLTAGHVRAQADQDTDKQQCNECRYPQANDKEEQQQYADERNCDQPKIIHTCSGKRLLILRVFAYCTGLLTLTQNELSVQASINCEKK